MDAPPFVVSRYVGPTLRTIITKNNPSFDETFDLLRDVCEAVADAHSAGVSHLDINPENVVVAGNRAFLIDFGICMFDDDDLVTLVDAALGPRGFAPPELDSGRTVEPGPYSDIYMTGKLIHWALSGKGPFSREELTEDVLAQIPQPRGVERAWISLVLDRTVIQDHQKRTDARRLLLTMQEAGRLMRLGVSPVGSADQLCMTCRRGRMRRIQPDQARTIGLLPMGNVFGELRFLLCSYCGELRIHYLPASDAESLWRI